MSDDFVFSADWHLRRLTWVHRPQLVGDAQFSLEQLAQYCIQEDLPLIAAGDLFDQDRPDPGAVAGMLSAFSRASIPIYYVEGQHEGDPHCPWLSVLPNAIHAHKRAFQLGNNTFYGLNWAPAGEAQEQLATVPPNTRFLITHQVWTDHMGSIAKCDCALADLKGPVPYVLSGDYHVHQITEHPTAYGPVKLVSPGALSVRNLGELTPKAFYRWRNNAFESVPLKTRPVLKRTLVNDAGFDTLMQDIEAAQLEAIQQQYPSEVAVPIVVIEFTEDYATEFRKRLPLLQERAHIFDEMILSTPDAPQVQSLPAQEAPIGLVDAIEQALPKFSPQVRQNIATLLNSTQPPTVAVRELAAQIESRYAAPATRPS